MPLMRYGRRIVMRLQRMKLKSLVRVFLPTCALISAVAIAQRGEYLAGYLIVPISRVDRSFNSGFSMYVAAWPLLRNYPGHQFQTGLPGTWMFAQYDGEAPKKAYSDVEGGLGWWRDTRFPTTTPKFIMGGVGQEFSSVANGPSHGWGSWEKPAGVYGVAQLSPWLVFPIDGLNLKQGTCGQLFGYGYLNLPLNDPKPMTEGTNIPTGGNCWTLFINSKTFKGPVAFFLPNFWSHGAVQQPRLAGMLLDTRPSEPNRAVQMETQYIPCRIAKDANGNSYARIAPTAFPRGADGNSTLIEQDTVYNADALTNSVASWFKGGPPSSGLVDAKGAAVRKFEKGGYATWEFHTPGADGKEERAPIEWKAFATPVAPTSSTYGYQWDYRFVTKTQTPFGSLVTLPEYFRLEPAKPGGKPIWRPITGDMVPTETELQKIVWSTPKEKPEPPYTTPEQPKSSFKKPGPVAGPFKIKLGDGSTVTYSWYRFADQPALLNADLSDGEREAMQKKVEMIHRNWKKDRNYLAPPKSGELAELDPAQIVRPPKGFEIGYVPIATWQELTK